MIAVQNVSGSSGYAIDSGDLVKRSVDLSRIRLLTFDLDNTLWDVWPVIDRAHKAFLNWVDQTHPMLANSFYTEAVTTARQQLLQADPLLVHQPTRFRKSLMLQVFTAAHPAIATEVMEGIVEDGFKVFFTERNRIDFYTGVVPMLEALSRTYGLIAISNGNADLELVGLKQFFRHQLSAEQTLKPKPDPWMFEEALRVAGVRPNEAIHIGDHLQEDVEAARKVGMHSVWFNPARDQLEALSNHPHSGDVVSVSSIGELTSLLMPRTLHSD
jgi:HAD superfamily hydrolase (TIGR01509 family)